MIYFVDIRTILLGPQYPEPHYQGTIPAFKYTGSVRFGSACF
jgi:hypothetical protein